MHTLNLGFFMAVFLALVVGCDGSDFAGVSGAKSKKEKTGDPDVDAGDGDSDGDDDDDADDGGDDPAGVDDGEADGGDVLTGDEAVALRKKCAEASVKELEFELDFPSTAAEQDCKWGQDGNLAYQEHSGKVNGFRAQEASFSIPDGAVICGVTMTSSTPSVRYDDYLFIDLEGYVVGASSHTVADMKAAGMTETNGLIAFDPAKALGQLATTVSHNSKSSSICPAGGTCTIPSSDEAQPMALDVPTGWFDLLPKATLTKQSFKMTVRVSGQGDSQRQDCEHTGFKFSGVAKYVEP